MGNGSRFNINRNVGPGPIPHGPSVFEAELQLDSFFGSGSDITPMII